MISLIIPTYNRKGLNEKCFTQALKDRSGLEVIWVDDGSTDGTQDILKQFNPDISILNKNNKGVASAYNQGLKMANGDWIGIMDSDFYMPDNWLSEVKKYLEREPDVLGIQIKDFERWCGEKKEDWHIMDFIMGFYICSKELYNRVGLYNEGLGWYAPIDIEWNNRAKKFKPEAYCIPDIKIEHIGRGEYDTGEYRDRKTQGLYKNPHLDWNSLI